jgi:spermidine/putrescine transport system permease protein
VSVAATVLCVLLAIPTAYAMARAPERWRRTILLLVVIPFWTSFLVRVFAWKTLLHPDGPVKALPVALGLVSPETTLLYNVGAVLLVTVHTDLPFAILPIYAAAEKFDQRLLEAGRDLGAGWWTVARRVLLPLLAPGFAAGGLLAFTLSIDDFVITFFVSGPGSTTLPLRIYSMIKLGSPPLINALSTLMLTVTFPAAAVSQRLAAGKPGTARDSNHPG